jgi:hypothetical protein
MFPLLLRSRPGLKHIAEMLINDRDIGKKLRVERMVARVTRKNASNARQLSGISVAARHGKAPRCGVIGAFV